MIKLESMAWTPHVTVAVVAEKEHRFLVVEETAGGQIVLNQPAGHLEDGESLAQAAIRETLEETGWHVTLSGVVGTYLWKHPHNQQTFLRICFAANCVQHDTNRALDTGIIAAHWMSRDELISRQVQLRSPMVLTCIDDYVQNTHLPLDSVRYLDANC